MKRSVVFVALLLFPLAEFGASKSEWNGLWWSSLTPSFKLGWVTGYAKAMDFAGTIQLTTCASNLQMYQKEFPNVPAKDILQKMCMSDTTFDYDGVSMGQFVDGMDTFYKDYRNRQLEVGWAIQYVRDEIKGKPAKELDAEIATWRRCSSAMQTGDDEQIKKACTPDDYTPPQK